MKVGTYSGTVEISHGGLWVLQDSEPEGWGYDRYDSNFAGPTGNEGIYLISGHFASPIEVTVEVHDGQPEAPSGWDKSALVQASYPSKVARAWCEVLDIDERLANIELLAERVEVRVLVNGWTTPPNPGGEPESWLLQIWPAVPMSD